MSENSDFAVSFFTHGTKFRVTLTYVDKYLSKEIVN